MQIRLELNGMEPKLPKIFVDAVQVLYSCDIKVHTTHWETTKEQAHRVMATLTTRYTYQNK